MDQRLPDFLYIGPSKAGSTWLHEVLVRHPMVYMTEAKDLYFFDRYYDRGLEWYANQFRGAGPEHAVVGEVCQEYLFNPDAPKRISDCLVDVRLMVTVREPAARAFSGYLYMLKHGVYEGSFRQALRDRPGLLGHALYATHLTRYLEYFDRSAIYCAVFDDLQADPQGFLDPLLNWLGVPPMVLDDELLAPRLAAQQARSVPVARLVKAAANWSRTHHAAKLIGHVKRSPAVQRVLYRPLRDDRPQMSPDDARYVQDRMTSEIARLEDLFGLDLRRRWGWDA